MKFMRQYLLSLLLTFAMVTGSYAAADLGNTSVISPTDASNGSGTCPSWLGSAAPSTLDDSGRCLQGAIAREWQNRSFAVTSTGSANAYVVAYTVAPAALRTGQVYSFITNFANTGTATVNINTLGAKTIKKDVAGTLTALSSGDMGSGQYVMLAYNGTDMIWVNWQGAAASAASTSASGISELLTTTEVLTGTDTTRTATADSIAALWEAGSDVSDGAAITIGEGGYFNLITSTTAITSFSITTDKAGRTFRVRFDTARTLTHNATSLIIPGGANITTAQGDIAQIRSLGSGNVVVDWYTKASGLPVVETNTGMTLLSTLTTTSGTTQSATGLAASTYKKYYIEVDGVSFSSSVALTVAISGDNGSNYGTAVTISPALGAGSQTLNGSFEIGGINIPNRYGATLISGSIQNNNGASGLALATLLLGKNATGATGAVDAIQFAGGTFDAGEIRIYGVK